MNVYQCQNHLSKTKGYAVGMYTTRPVPYQEVEEENTHGHDEDDPEKVGGHREQEVVLTPVIVEIQHDILWSTHREHYDGHNGVPQAPKRTILGM